MIIMDLASIAIVNGGELAWPCDIEPLIGANRMQCHLTTNNHTDLTARAQFTSQRNYAYL